MIRASGSKLELLSRCGYWAREGVPWTDLTSDEAKDGKALHALAASRIAGTYKHEPLGSSVSVLAAAVWAGVLLPWLEANIRIGWTPEVAFAYDPERDTARILATNAKDRNYAAMGCDLENEMPLTADVVYLGEDEHGPFGCVDDFKWSGFHGDDLVAEFQLKGLGLAMARAYGVDRVRCRAIRISEDTVNDTKEVYWLDCFELERVASDIQRDLTAVATAEPVEGPWCSDRWCPAVAACPKTARALAQVIPATALVRDHRLTTEITTKEHAAWTYSALKMVAEATERIGKRLREYVDKNGGIELPDGKVYDGYEVTEERAQLSTAEAIRELEAMGLASAVEAKVTWAALTRVGGKEKADQARELLREMGAVKANTYKKYEPRSPPKAPKAAKKGKAA